MPDTARPKSALWTEATRHVDVMVVACLMLVAGLGMVGLHDGPVLPPAPERPVILAEARPAPAPPQAVRPAPKYYPWKAPEPYHPALPERADPVIPRPDMTGFKTQLRDPQADPVFRASTHDNNNSFYGAHWRQENVTPTSSGTLLSVQRVKGLSLPYTAGEIQSQKHYGHGRYEAILRPSRGSGLATAFFTYTGPWFGNPHDEIDIEFLGQDTTKVHFNYFRRGRTGKSAIFDLPFDAADADRLYAFEWTPEGITWFVEGVPYYATEPGDDFLPQVGGKVMFSAWTGVPHMQGWLGKPTFPSGAGMHVSCSSFVPLGQTGPSCADVYTPPVVLSP